MSDKIFAVIPAFNEKKHIKDVIRKTKEYVDQVIVVDDGSTDNTSVLANDTDAVVLRRLQQNISLCLRVFVLRLLQKNISVVLRHLQKKQQ